MHILFLKENEAEMISHSGPIFFPLKTEVKVRSGLWTAVWGPHVYASTAYYRPLILHHIDLSPISLGSIVINAFERFGVETWRLTDSILIESETKLILSSLDSEETPGRESLTYTNIHVSSDIIVLMTYQTGGTLLDNANCAISLYIQRDIRR